MDYEKAYKEALNWMRSIYPTLTGSDKEDAEHYFPELAESEDESLKNKSGYYKAGKFWKASTLWNATKNKIPQRVSNRYILQECTWNIGNLQDFANEVKNVQEVSLDYPIILDMNGNIIDGAHRVVKAYLEGKDIDIVYIEDDEWPKPDYDEEKAVKESEDERIRKHIVKFIDEQYPTHGNLKEEKNKMLAYIEKQKESLHIPETCKENADSFTEDERIRQWLYNLVDEGAYLCERPCATESILAYLEKQKEKLGDISTILLVKKEIERRIETWQKSRKELIAMECNTLADDAAVRIEELYSLISFLGTIRCNTNEKQKEQKPQTDDEKEYIRTIKSIISDFIRDKKPEDLAYYQRIYDWLDGRHVPFSCGHEKGQPAEWAELQSEFKNINEAFEDGKKEVIDHPDKYGLTKQKTPDPVFSKQEYESHPIISKDTTSVKPRELDGKTLLYTADKSYQIGFRDGVASVKPAEWSEEDEKTINDACCWIAEYAGYLMDKNYGKASMLMGLTDKLKSLRPQSHCKISEELDTDTLRDWSMRFTPDIREAIESTAYHFYNLGSQPKQEWSDEDKAILEWCIADIERAKSHPSQTKPELCDIEINWLKALNLKKRNEDVAKLCSNEWSEEDKAFLKVAIATCNRYSHKDIADWLKSLPERLNLQPKEEWSEEDEKKINFLSRLIEFQVKDDEYCFGDGRLISKQEAIEMLKSLRPSWKPSEEQMNALYDILYPADTVNRLVIESLYNDLKKLM